MTCEDCRWKVERGECPWNYEYKDTDYAEDCDDFRYIEFQETAFNEIKMNKLNPRFPYRMEKAKWYLMFLLLEKIISEDEFDDLYGRLPDEFK